MPQVIQTPTRQQARLIANNCLDAAMAALRKSKDLREDKKWIRAAACLELAQEFVAEGTTLACIANGGPEPGSTEETELANRAAKCAENVADVAEIVNQNEGETATGTKAQQWYRRKEAAIINHDLLEAMERVPDKQEDLREAVAIVAESVLAWDAVTQEEPNAPRPRAKSGEHTLEILALEEEAETAARLGRERAKNILQRYDESLVFECSPRMKPHQKVAREAREISTSPCSMLIGVSLEHRDQDETDQQDATTEGKELVPFIVASHKGRKLIKHLADPYPKGYPKLTAIAQMEGVINMIDNDVPDSGGEHASSYRTVRQMAQDAITAADLEVHDVAGTDMERLVTAAKKAGLPPGAAFKLAKAVTGNNRRITQYLDDKDAHRWTRTVPKKTALAMIHRAREDGVDEYALAETAEALGFEPNELGCQAMSLPEGAVDDIIMAARLTGISEKAIERIAREL